MNNTYETKYGLYHIEDKSILTFYKTSNEGYNFCGSHTVELNTYEGEDYKVWLVDSAKQAEWTRVFNQKWYNSDMDSPVCNYDPQVLKVIEVKIIKEYKFVDVSIPTKYDFYKDKYANTNPKHWERLKKDIDKISPYLLYELEEYNG